MATITDPAASKAWDMPAEKSEDVQGTEGTLTPQPPAQPEAPPPPAAN